MLAYSPEHKFVTGTTLLQLVYIVHCVGTTNAKSFAGMHWSASSSRQEVIFSFCVSAHEFTSDFFTINGIIKGCRTNPSYKFLANFIVKYRLNRVKTLLHPTFCHCINGGSCVSVLLKQKNTWYGHWRNYRNQGCIMRTPSWT